MKQELMLKFGIFSFGMVLLFPTSIKSQTRGLACQFGIHIPKPYVISNTTLRSVLSHNFWIGTNYWKQLNAKTIGHVGLIANGINYRFTSIDSPTTTFLTMTYIGLPLQLAKRIHNSKFAIKGGIELKYMFSGHEYTADPTQSSTIKYELSNGIYQRLNLGLKAGISYREKNMEYFLQLGADLYPFKTYKSTRIFDQKITFGFNMFQILEKYIR